MAQATMICLSQSVKKMSRKNKEDEHPSQGALFEIEIPKEDIKPKKKKAKPIATCSVCGKGLSDPQSVSAGYGPVCMHNHYAVGQKDYVENLFMLEEDLSHKKIANFTIEAFGENTLLITDLDNNQDKPSVTNSIDEILRRLCLDKHNYKIVCLGTDDMFTLYNGTWRFLGWTEKEALNSLKLRGEKNEL